MFGFGNKSTITEEQKEMIIKSLEAIEQFVLRERNSINLHECKMDGDIAEICKKISSIAQKIEQKNLNDLGTNGEMLLLVEKMADGNFEDRIHLYTDDPYLKYFAKMLNKVAISLHNTMLSIISTLKEYGNGNFRPKLDFEHLRDGELKELLKGVNQLKMSLETMLYRSLKCGENVQGITQDLVNDAKRVSYMFQDQNQEIEKIEEILDDVVKESKENIDESNEMKNRYEDAKRIIEKGMLHAKSTNKIMEEIHLSNESIREMVEVIEQIAFQTNILSLNAAVEAATAGEAGKGFAVVAQEVRNLANKSTDVAKKIKERVGAATEKSTDGKNKANEMTEVYSTILDSIQKMSEIINKSAKKANIRIANVNELKDLMIKLDERTKENLEIAKKTEEKSSELSNISSFLIESIKDIEFGDLERLSKLNTCETKILTGRS